MDADLTTVLLAGADELVELAAVADGLGTLGVADIERWQALDRLSQHLAGIASFLTDLADAVPQVTLDLSEALGALKTAALADRLAGRYRDADDDPGALELFGT